MQISAPTSYSWVGLGVGSQQMAGTNMFIMYADGKGNVTVSSRQGKGNVQPQYSASTASDLQLQEGSGVVDGKMVANILCTNCKTWSGGSLSTTSTSSAWIAAWKEGAALDSTSPSESIAIHDGHSAFNIDLTQATIATDSNPFTSTAAAATPSSSGGTSSSSGVSQSAPMGKMAIWAHGLGMAIVFVIMYPLGSALMPLLGKWMFHAGWMVLTWLGMWTFFGLGVYGARQRDLVRHACCLVRLVRDRHQFLYCPCANARLRPGSFLTTLTRNSAPSSSVYWLSSRPWAGYITSTT